VVDQILKEKEERRLLMFITLWSLWSERNTVREEGRRRSAENVARAIQIYAGELGLGSNKTSKAKDSGSVDGTLEAATGGVSEIKLRCLLHTE
jgi:hypothetical protein